MDLVEIAVYIGQGSITAAERFLAAAEAAFTQLSAMPGMGAVCQFVNPAAQGLRFWPITGFRRYLIFYRPLADGIEVVRVIHGARDLERVISTNS